MLRLAGALVRRVPPLRRLAASLHGAFLAQRELDAEIAELTPIDIRTSAPEPGPRTDNVIQLEFRFDAPENADPR